MSKQLPVSAKMIMPVFLTFFRKKTIHKEGILIKKEFKDVSLERESLLKYKKFFDWQEDFPLAFFYLTAQRAQVSVMLEKEFTLPIVGMVHISNTLELLGNVDYHLPFDLEVSVSVPYKEAGSLISKCVVNFIQNNQKVIVCESTNLIKRKSVKSKSIQSEKNETPSINPTYQEPWKVEKNMGILYADASGDKNPIHSSTLFARMVGFKMPILQGWCSVTHLVKNYEVQHNIKFRYIEVGFNTPVYLPSHQTILFEKKNDNEVLFQIVNTDSRKLVLTGRLVV